MNILEEIQNCPVEWKELGEVVEVLDSLRRPITKSQRIPGDIPYYGANGIQDYVKDWIFDGTFILMGEDGSVIKNDNSPILHWVIGKIWVNNHAHILGEVPGCALLKYVYYVLSQTDVSDIVRGTPPKLNQKNLKSIKIPIPPLEIQEKIVQILDKMTEYVTELTSELTSRKKQYSFYRDKLLSFEDEVYQVEWKTLSEIAKVFGRGKSKHRPRNDARLYGGDIPFIQTGDIRGAGKWIENFSKTYSDFGLEQSKKWEKGTLCITIAANIAETGLLGFDACFPDSIIGFVANPEFAITEYVYYYLNSIKDHLANKSYGSAQDNLNLAIFSSLKIPVPSLEIQSRIVEVLDNFDTICNDLYIGLPKEIELRQKQYEYWRKMMFNFNKKGDSIL